jgi:TadE-like protein
MRSEGRQRWNPRRSIAAEDGTALAELALVLPLLLVVLLGILDFGKAFNYWIDSTHLANEGARFAAVHQRLVAGQSIEAAIKDQATTPELKSNISVCIWFPTDPDGDGVKGENGEPLEVVVKSNYNWLAYLVGKVGLAPTSIVRGTATMRIEVPYKNDGTYVAQVSCP